MNGVSRHPVKWIVSRLSQWFFHKTTRWSSWSSFTLASASALGAVRWGVPRTKAAPDPRATDLLHEDHQRILTLIAHFHHAGSFEEDKALTQEIIKELQAHFLLEEQHFYPAIREYLVPRSRLDLAVAEHQPVKDLMAELQRGASEATHYTSCVRELIREVRQHIREQETEIFPIVEKSATPLIPLGKRMLQRRRELEHDIIEPSFLRSSIAATSPEQVK